MLEALDTGFASPACAARRVDSAWAEHTWPDTGAKTTV